MKQTIDSFHRKRKLFSCDILDLDKNYSSLNINRGDINAAMDYCEESFGDGWLWSSPVHTETSKIWFLHSEYALLFKLRFNTV
jgi:hypothetical protein